MQANTISASAPYRSPDFHPLDPPTAEEITIATHTLRTWFAENGVKAFKFITVFLKEPPKAAVLAWLQWPTVSKPQPLERVFEVHAIDLLTGLAYEAYVRLDGDRPKVKKVTQLDAGIQPSLTPEELCNAEQCVRKDPRVIKLAAEVGIKPENISADGWSIGWDKRFGNKRVQQCLLYARFGKDENLYAHPMDFFPIIDMNGTGEVIAIDFPPHRTAKDGSLSSKTRLEPTEVTFDDPKDRERIPPPLEPHEYLPDLGKFEMRKDIKPLHVVQPEGVGFVRKGNMLEWGKFKVHVGFHPREGIVLSGISYKDSDLPGHSLSNPLERPLFYRISLSEMVVPYGDPAHPHYRKFAFDVGEYGLGYLANPLKLGCDCLGSIEYLDGVFAKHDGSVEVVKNAICIHEEDTGLLWKHTDFREGGRAHAVRGRKLVISMVCTVANYEYGIYWNFYMDGNIECEIKLTGILNLYVLGQGEDPAGFGTQVAPRINAHYHQHLFSLRIDPHVDGQLNSVVEQNIHCLDAPTGSEENWAGNGFTTSRTVYKTAKEAVSDANADTERSWAFINESNKHYASGKPAAYKIVCKDLPKLYCKPDSYVARRAPFAKHHFWTIPYDDERIYPAGKYVPQTYEAPADSIENWANEDAPIANADIVSYLTFGTTHIPRPEDFPVMPVDTVKCTLKPYHFFRRNPTLDVPSVKDQKSVAANAAASSSQDSQTGAGGESCCKL
ncbi:peroxisomal copper amine oxidase [Violaceomyces palustris]|uniref:Peroxisomal copper amine oxidase n=1 Tax=Violaceomyces palustris TaxID=1673888 RepID=A0ACD0NV08_9BASI|nr:peroxisomal copper amine oxidase [Violaceomyces palustris]